MRSMAEIRGTRLAALIIAVYVGWAADAPARPLDLLNVNVQKYAGGALAVLGFSIIPNETASTVQIDVGSAGDAQFLASQIGGAFTVSDSFPLYLEGFAGFARYDPKFVLSQRGRQSLVPVKWNNFAGTVGAGWDFRLTDELKLRPIANVSLGHIESDTSFLGRIIENEFDVKLDFLKSGRLNAYGYGGSLMLDYERYRPDYEVDVELRYTFIRLESFGGSSAAVRGTSDAETLGLWSRLRVPTGFMALDRPLRAVGEFSASALLGDQRVAVGTEYLFQIGGGLELDTGQVSWLPIERTRLMGRFLIGQEVRGFSVGLGLSF